MRYAQILNGIIINILELDDSNLLSLFSIGFDSCIQIDNISPEPSKGWQYDLSSTTFTPPLRLALVQNGTIINIINDYGIFITNNSANYQAIVNITGLDSPPQIGFIYNNDGTFTPSQAYYQAVVTAAIAFGQKIIVQAAALNVSSGITQAGKTLPFIVYTSNLALCLSSGSLYEAINTLNTMIADTSDAKTNLSPFLTNDKLYGILNQIQTYLGLPLTPNPGN